MSRRTGAPVAKHKAPMARGALGRQARRADARAGGSSANPLMLLLLPLLLLLLLVLLLSSKNDVHIVTSSH